MAAAAQAVATAPFALCPADRDALSAVLGARPQWVGEGTAAQLVGLAPDVLLHAGPPIPDLRAMARPVLNSACVAAVYEGLADGLDAAEALILGGAVRLEPAQDRDVVTPLAAVVSSSMKLHRVSAARNGAGATAFAPINGGSGPAARLGIRSMVVVEHLRWLNGPLADALRRAAPDRLDLIDIADRALAAGDDGHGRTIQATAELTKLLAPRLDGAALAFLRSSPMFFLNLWMAACKCMLLEAAGQPGSSLAIALGGNGAQVGLKVAGLPGRWFTATATPPVGELGPWPPERALGAVGDSAVIEAAGFGAMAMSHAPEQRALIGANMPADGLYRPARLLAARHPAFRRVTVYAGLFARRVVAIGRGPIVSLGILDAQGHAGRIGIGVVDAPVEPFRAAVGALADREVAGATSRSEACSGASPTSPGHPAHPI